MFLWRRLYVSRLACEDMGNMKEEILVSSCRFSCNLCLIVISSHFNITEEDSLTSIHLTVDPLNVDPDLTSTGSMSLLVEVNFPGAASLAQSPV